MAKDSMQSLRRDFDKRQQSVPARRVPKKRGELSELAFTLKAAGLGFAVAKPYGDSDRFDFIVYAGPHFRRVQVRSTSSLQYGSYQLTVHRPVNGQAMPYTADEIDFLAAHIVPEDAWFLIPVQAFTPPQDHPALAPELQNWPLLEVPRSLVSPRVNVRPLLPHVARVPHVSPPLPDVGFQSP